MKIVITILAGLFLTLTSQAQTIYASNYKHKIRTYPKFFNAEGRRTYSVVVDAENGAESHWGMNINAFVKNYCALEGMTLTNSNPAFKVEVKLFRKTEGATPLQYQISDDKGNILLFVGKDDPRNLVPINTSPQSRMFEVLRNFDASLRAALDFGSYKGDLSSYTLNQNKEEFKAYTDLQSAVDRALAYHVLAPAKTLTYVPVKETLQTWKSNHSALPLDDKKVRNIRLLTSYNIAGLYAFNGQLDSAEKWLGLAKAETSDNPLILELETFITFQKQNLKNYLQVGPILSDVAYTQDIKQANMALATSRSFALKEKEDLRELPPNSVKGYIVKAGKRIDGDFIPPATGNIDFAFVRFMPATEKTAKLITPFSADSLALGDDKYLAMTNKFAKIFYESSKLRILEYIPVSSASVECCPFYYFVKKGTNQTESFAVGLGRISKFISKYFSDCPAIIEKQTSGAYENLGTVKAFSTVAADFTQLCN